MAELLVGQGWAVTDPLAIYLHDALPDEYFVVSEPIVQREAFDAVVVGPQGLFVLHGRDAPADRFAPPSPPWWQRVLSSRKRHDPDLITEGFRAQQAIRTFLRDEFSSLHVMIRDFPVWALPGPVPRVTDPVERAPLTKEQVAEAIIATKPMSRWITLDVRLRETLALALQERQLTASQRATEPFIFRSGGALGGGHKAWTIRDVVTYIDLHPDDGVYHLLNGTLEHWFDEQGAGHLAALVRKVTQHREGDGRVTLESFLLGSGLVPRPRLAADPKTVDLGYVLVGHTASSHLRVMKGRGRGYLYGSLNTSDSWLRVEPRKLAGKPLDAIVTANTEGLPVTSGPRTAEIRVTSNASEELTVIPVSLRVMARPSRLNRYLLRPMLGVLSAGAVGAAAGWALSMVGVGKAAESVGLQALPIANSVLWPSLLGLFWALLGAIHGAAQPLSWPSSYTWKRLGLRTLVWGLTLALLAGGILWGLYQVNPGAAMSLSQVTSLRLLLLAPAFAILPAIVGELQVARSVPGAERNLSDSTTRPVVWSGIIVALLFVTVMGARVLAPSWRQVKVEGRTSALQQWTDARWTDLGKTVDGLLEKITLMVYDRRAPSMPPTPAPTPKAQPTSRPAD